MRTWCSTLPLLASLCLPPLAPAQEAGDGEVSLK